jgi:hypothetical protein
LLFKWWYLQESNQGHKDFQSFALPTELRYLTVIWAANVLKYLLQQNFSAKLKWDELLLVVMYLENHYSLNLFGKISIKQKSIISILLEHC